MTANRNHGGGSAVNLRGVLVAAAAAACVAASASGEVITGSMNDVGLNGDFFNAGVFGDGTNGVQFIAGFAWWAAGVSSGGMWFYGSEFNYDEASLVRSEVAFVPGVLDVSQITDASIYSYTTNAADTSVAVTGGPLMFGSEHGLVLLRNEATGHYGALRLDGMRVDNPFGFDADGIDVTWWFQTDGSGDFSSVPAPASAALLVCSGVMGSRRRR